MKVLVACEFSGIVREAFAKRGHNACRQQFILWLQARMPSEEELEILIHAPNKFKIDLYLAKKLAHICREEMLRRVR
jgi:hypothetical protein